MNAGRVRGPALRFFLPAAMLLAMTCSSEVTGPTAPSVRRLLPAAVTNGLIAFQREVSFFGFSFSTIHVMNPDGSGQVQITEGHDIQPAWSPRGDRIAFARLADDYDIYVVDPDGSEPTNLTNHSNNDLAPAWSPDASRIAFTSYRDGNGEIYVMRADGSGQTRLTNNADYDDHPTWSADGTRIAFQSHRDGNFEIYVMNADGSGQVNLTNDAQTDQDPAWSPDGSRIAFSSARTGNFEIYVMNPDGSGIVNLTNHGGTDFRPAWSPDGTKIAFVTDRTGNVEIFVMNADGTAPANITAHADIDDWPSWGVGLDADSDGDGHPNLVDNCLVVSNPGQSDLDGDGTGDACEESRGSAGGDGTNRHGPVGDHPGAAATFAMNLSAQSPPSGSFTYDLGGARGRLVSQSVSYLEVLSSGRVYAAGMGTWSGLPGRGWCLLARDGGRRQADQIELLVFHPADGGSCRRPRLRFVGTVERGDLRARQ